MRFSTLSIALFTLPFALAAPVKRALLDGILSVPDVSQQLSLDQISEVIKRGADAAIQRGGEYDSDSNTVLLLQKYVPIANTLDSVVGADNLVAFDVLADHFCIAGRAEGSVCNEILAYAYAWYVAQQKGYTYHQVAALLGANNMAAINHDLNLLCLTDDNTIYGVGICQYLTEDTDVAANTVIGENDNRTEDDGNTNTLEWLGLSQVLPKPTTVT